MVGGKTDLIWPKMVLPALKELTKLTFCCHRCENQVVLLRVTDSQFVTKTNINKQGFNNLRALLYFVLPANDAGPKKKTLIGSQSRIIKSGKIAREIHFSRIRNVVFFFIETMKIYGLCNYPVFRPGSRLCKLNILNVKKGFITMQGPQKGSQTEVI